HNNLRLGDAVVFYSSDGEPWFSGSMYLNTCYYSRSYPWPFAMLTHLPDEPMLFRLRQFNHVWLVNRSVGMTGEKLMPGAMVDGYQFFPFTAICQRVTPDASRIQPPVVPPKAMS